MLAFATCEEPEPFRHTLGPRSSIGLCPYSPVPGAPLREVVPHTLGSAGSLSLDGHLANRRAGAPGLFADTTCSWLHAEAAMAYSPAEHAGWPDLGALVCLFYLLPFHNRWDSKNVYQLLTQWLTSVQTRKSVVECVQP